MPQPGGGDPQQLEGQLTGGDIAQSQQGRVGDPVELIADGPIDLGNPVPVHVAPQRRDAVEIASARGVDQLEALGSLDDRGLLAGMHPHGSEGMPHLVGVGPQEFVESHGNLAN